MPNRYNRDELIKIALDMSQVPNLKVHDCPNGVVQPDAYSIQWLQDIIDFWYHMVPFSSGVRFTSLNVPALTTNILLPTDFILDVRDGYIMQNTDDVNSRGRKRRLPLQKWINRDLAYQHTSGSGNSVPMFYTILYPYIKVTPQSSTTRSAWLWHYFLPPALQSNETPLFPNDYVLIEYVRIRSLEWCGHFEPGTAQKFCDKIVSGMKAAGLMNEPEDDEIPFDSMVYKGGSSINAPWAWMGPV